jgi:hypothetical protein
MQIYFVKISMKRRKFMAHIQARAKFIAVIFQKKYLKTWKILALSRIACKSIMK